MERESVPDCTLGLDGPDAVFERLGSGYSGAALVLRTGRMWQVRMALESLAANAPDVAVDILCQPSARRECASIERVRQVIDYPAEKISLRFIPLSLLLEIRRKKYGLIVIVLNNEFGFAFENVYRVAALLGGRKILKYNPFFERWDFRPPFAPGKFVSALIAPFVLAAAIAAAAIEALSGIFVKPRK